MGVILFVALVCALPSMISGAVKLMEWAENRWGARLRDLERRLDDRP
jgi:hypothetical protein